jgi:hypothetical protein
MGGMAMGKCKNRQIKSCITKKIVNILKEDMEDCHLVMFTHAMDFLKECMSLKKPIPKPFIISLLDDLLIKDLITLGNLLWVKAW